MSSHRTVSQGPSLLSPTPSCSQVRWDASVCVLIYCLYTSQPLENLELSTNANYYYHFSQIILIVLSFAFQHVSLLHKNLLGLFCFGIVSYFFALFNSFVYPASYYCFPTSPLRENYFAHINHDK